MAPPRMSIAAAGNPSLHTRVSSFGATGEPPPSALRSARKSFAPGTAGFSGIQTSSQPTSSQLVPPSSVRRSSSYNRLPGSQIAAGNGFFSSNIISTGVIKDPRPLRDRQWLSRIAGEILEYLAANNFEAETKYQVSPNFLKSPTQKDFTMVFEYLYHRLDPNYHFAKPMDQEVLPILKTLRYPYATAITKSSLAAVGGANTWPTFLAMLHWLLDLVKTMEQIDAGDFEAIVEEDSGLDVGTDRIVFDFSAKSYQAWLQGTDDHQEYINEMVTAFDERVARFSADIEELTHRNTELHDKLGRFNHTNADGKTPLQVLEEEKVILEKDKEKFIAYIQTIEGRIANTTAANVRLREKVAELDAELKQLEEERQSLQRAVDKQGLSPADIDRMASEREKLDKGLAQTTARIEELKVKAAEKEQEAASKLEYLERAVNRYNTLAYQIGIIPSTATNAGGKHYEFVLFPNKVGGASGDSRGGVDLMQIDDEGVGGPDDNRLLFDAVTGYQPVQLVNCDLRHDIKPALNKLRQDISERIHQLQDEGFRGNELIDRVNEALADLKEEVETLQARVQVAQAEFEGIKEVGSQLWGYPVLANLFRRQ